MFSGEAVIQILNAESAGFILAFSTGRIAYMSVRDGQGRPAISVQFLRGSTRPANSGIFGSIRSVLSTSGLRGDIAAVRAGRLEKVGERNVVVATAKGKIQSWNIHRGGHSSLNAETDAREAIVVAIKETVPALNSLLLESFEILDFTYTPKPAVDPQLNGQDDQGVNLLLLASLTDRHNSHYSLVEVVLKRDEFIIGNVRPISSYTTPVARTAISKPRIYLPNPALVAYIVFDRAVVVVSMAKQPVSPDSQLRSESHLLPQTFEDVIDFREDMNVEIIGSGMEEPHGQPPGMEESKSRRYRAKYPAVVLLVRGGGVVRVAATDITKLTSSNAQQVTAKSKLEQAVFFGNVERNPLSFAVRPELQFPTEEVGAAALELSLDILKSRTPYIASVPASIDQNLRKRSAALRDLAHHLNSTGVALDRVTRWKLLWDAEKMAAATLIWKRYDARIKEKPVGQKRGLLAELVEFIHEDYKTEPVSEAGELDRVRHWFINDVWNLEVAVPWAFQVIKYTYQDGQKDHGFVFEILSEANDLVLGALDGAFDFRTRNLELYGLQSEKLEHGILAAGYEGLPDIWTSTIYIVENARKQAELAGLLVKEYWDKPEREGQPNVFLVNKVRQEHSTLIDVAIRTSKERIRWDLVQESPQWQIEGEQIKIAQSAAQDDQLTILATDLGLPDEAINLTEKHEILSTLASILLYELNGSASKLRDTTLPAEETSYWVKRSEILHTRVKHLFNKFGTRWATALYEYEINLGSMSDLLDEYPEQREYLAAFLRSRAEYVKVAWIHEITRERDFDQAAKTLLDLGLQREQDMWSKKIELSMGKLARLAGRDYSQANGILIPDGRNSDLVATDNQLALIKIQNQVYDYVLTSIDAAIDEKAELQLALEAHANKLVARQPTFMRLLEENMAHLIKHEAMDALTLVDLLTLMGDGGRTEEDDQLFRGQQFYLALQASRYGFLSTDEQLLTQRVIWRRCMLRDDWVEVNNTSLKDDEQVKEQSRKTALYLTFRACLKNRESSCLLEILYRMLTVGGLFDKNSTVRPISPHDVLGACRDELDHRFTRLDASIREMIMKAMQVEDEKLKPYIEKARLDKWYESILDLAKEDSEKELTEETNSGASMKDVENQLAEVERGIAEGERRKAESLLHSKPRYKPKAKMNGSVAKFRSSIKQY